jgi:amino acid transporter
MSDDHYERDWDDSPRRRYGDDRDDDDELYGRDDPRQKVRGPGLALMIVDALGVFFSFGVIALSIFLLVESQNRFGQRQTDDEITAIALIVCGILSVVACLIVAIGGARMRNCRSWGLSMTAAILAVASIVLFGLCSLFTLPFGIWALVVLSNSEVKREFQRVAMQGNQESHDYSD